MHFAGRDRIPAAGPTMLFGNHPNDLPDVLAGYFTTERPVRYIATIAGTTMPMAAAVYRVLGVIPVTRIRDVRKMREKGVDVAEVNRTAFDAVRRAFHVGEAIGVFPEGGVQDSSDIGRLRQGVAKMALDSLDDDLKNDITMVPFGLQYDAPQTMRSDVSVVIGRPFSLREWKETHTEPTSAALCVRLHEELVAVSRTSPSWEIAERRDRLVAMVAAVVATPDEPLLLSASRLQAKCRQLVEVGEPGPSPESRTDWTALADEMAVMTEKVGGIGTSPRDCARVLDSAGIANAQAQWPSRARVIINTIPAACGLLLNGPLQLGVCKFARAIAIDRTDIVARTIVPGLHLILVGYAVVGALIALWFRAVSISAWWAIPIVMLLPRLGDVGLAWRDDVRALRLRGRVQRLPEAERANIKALANRVQSAWANLSRNPGQS